MSIIVSTKDLRKTYERGTVKALDGVTLDIHEGEFFGIIGPDGAGKTTLYRLLSTLLKPDGGTARVDGMDIVDDYKSIRKNIGYMPGRFSLYKDLTVEENLRFFATTFGTTPEANRHLIDDIYRQIEPFKNRRAGKLSGGMKQKLALCCTLIHSPRIIFLDEPTTGIDVVSRRELFAMLTKLNRQYGITIIVSTPYRDEVMACSRIALLENGKVTATGRPEDVLPQETAIIRDSTPLDNGYAIEADGLTKQFGDFIATDHITFKVRKGEIFGFLGANGAGKTTAMKMLCGLSQPSDGRASVAGYDCATQYEEIKKHIGYMSQNFALYEDLTVAENMTLYGGIYGMTKQAISRRTDELLEELGATEIRHTMVKSLPLGWKQKLAFCVSIFHNPDIVFLDEPTGGVDADTRKQFWQMIYRTAERGMTIFVTTHYMDEAEYCHRISIMVDGKIEALDTPEQLKRKYGVTTMYDVFLYLARQAKRT
ncbi:MAG: ATP-binding cassette domain-containing protein [Prevotella sp.]